MVNWHFIKRCIINFPPWSRIAFYISLAWIIGTIWKVFTAVKSFIRRLL